MISEVLLESFTLIWDMYGEAIDQVPDKQWKTGEIDYLTPSRIISHVLMSGDFYSGNITDFGWNSRFSSSPMDLRQDQLPSKEKVAEYHIYVKDKITKLLRSHKMYPFQRRRTFSHGLELLE